MATSDFITSQNIQGLISEIQKRISYFSIEWYYDHWIIRDCADRFTYGEADDLIPALQQTITQFDQLKIDKPRLLAAWRDYAERHGHNPETKVYYENHRDMNIWCADIDGNSTALGPTNGGIQGAIDWMNSH